MYPRDCACANREQRSTWREDERVFVRVRSMNGGGKKKSWREANGGQPEHEELACDGSCPGLILSVCAG